MKLILTGIPGNENSRHSLPRVIFKHEKFSDTLAFIYFYRLSNQVKPAIPHVQILALVFLHFPSQLWVSLSFSLFSWVQFLSGVSEVSPLWLSIDVPSAINQTFTKWSSLHRDLAFKEQFAVTFQFSLSRQNAAFCSHRPVQVQQQPNLFFTPLSLFCFFVLFLHANSSSREAISNA